MRFDCNYIDRVPDQLPHSKQKTMKFTLTLFLSKILARKSYSVFDWFVSAPAWDLVSNLFPFPSSRDLKIICGEVKMGVFKIKSPVGKVAKVHLQSYQARAPWTMKKYRLSCERWNVK